MCRYFFYNNMSRETKISLFKLYLELKDDIYNHQLKYLKDFIEKNKDSVETMQIAEKLFQVSKDIHETRGHSLTSIHRRYSKYRLKRLEPITSKPLHNLTPLLKLRIIDD